MAETLEQLKTRLGEIELPRRTQEEEEIIAKLAYQRHLQILADSKILLGI